MRILMVNDLALDAGWGAERYVARLRDGLRAAGEEVETFAGTVARRGGGRVLDVWDPFARRSLARLAARFRPDVVHFHNIIRELSVSVLGGVPEGCASVLTVHDLRLFGVPDGRSGPLRLAAVSMKSRWDRAVLRRRVDVAVGVSEEIARRLRDAGFSFVEALPVFASTPPAPATSGEGSNDIVFAGRLTPDKGAHVLLEAFRRIAGDYPGARLVIAGDGPEGERLREAAAGLGDRVVFLGVVEAEVVSSAMGRARMIVAPVVPWLRPEGAGLTVIEAALLGRPSLVSDDVALREPIDRSGGGRVVEPGSPTALAGAIAELLADGALAARLGEAARRSALERNTTEAAIPRMQAIYRTAVEIARARRR